MSTQIEFNSNPNLYIIYYCNYVNSDPALYDYLSLSDICGIIFDIDNIQIVDWLIAGYLAPAISTLLTYTLVDVQAFVHSFYEEASEISMNQHYKISSSDLAACRVDSSMIGYMVYNTTTQKQQYLNSSLVWTDLY